MLYSWKTMIQCLSGKSMRIWQVFRRSWVWIPEFFLSIDHQFLSLSATLTSLCMHKLNSWTTVRWVTISIHWQIQDFEKGVCSAMPKVAHRLIIIEVCGFDPSTRSAEKRNRLHFSSLFRMGSGGTFMLCTARGVGNTQFPCTRFRNHVISIVISWFQQWFHDFYKDFRLQWFQISTLTALRTA